MSSEGRIAVVTGGTGGIGSVICQRLEKEGATVIALSYSMSDEDISAWQDTYGANIDVKNVDVAACDEHYQSLFIPALQDALHKIKQRHATLAVIGLSIDNPLVSLIEKNFHTHSYQTCIETVSWKHQDQPVLTSNKVQPEVAIL